MFRWDRLTNEYSEFTNELLEYVKGLIKMRRSIPAFRLNKTETINKYIRFLSDKCTAENIIHSFKSYKLKKLRLKFKNGTAGEKYYLAGEIHKNNANPLNNPYVLLFDKNGYAEIKFNKNEINKFDLQKWDNSRNLNFKLVKTPGNWDYPKYAYTEFGHNSVSPESINKHFETEIDLNITDFKDINTNNNYENNYIAYTLNNTIEKDISDNFKKIDFKQIAVIHNPAENILKVEFEKMNLKKYFVIADSKNAGITKLSETEVIIKENHVLVPKKSSAVITCL